MEIQIKVIDISEEEQKHLMENIKKREKELKKLENKKRKKKKEKKEPQFQNILINTQKDEFGLGEKDWIIIEKETRTYIREKIYEEIEGSGITISQWYTEKRAELKKEADKLGKTIPEWKKWIRLKRKEKYEILHLINKLAELKNK